jgi:hypothetical protein
MKKLTLEYVDKMLDEAKNSKNERRIKHWKVARKNFVKSQEKKKKNAN